MGNSVENMSVDDFLEFISAEGETFLSYTTFQLGQFVENGFLKTLFDKNPQRPMDKAQLLIYVWRVCQPKQLCATGGGDEYTTNHPFTIIFYSPLRFVQVVE
ncbi:hypothetical protein RirG_271120 [Rhizophagus irregularis DAOM 197198w]|uniref:Uncharacterized protein n=1 Tax=Rhizophagus irregularis (strain DAOM 197198w) TaxID=1432141 RepID=A0A015JTG1_RHIIW|nr:hypothetical protein RirG_271120 [Rhizophagus irregularis DAOM 197198w]